MNQLGRTGILYVFLELGLQGAQWQIHSENLAADDELEEQGELGGAVISHQEV